jgi:hypothetical protein
MREARRERVATEMARDVEREHLVLTRKER